MRGNNSAGNTPMAPPQKPIMPNRAVLLDRKAEARSPSILRKMSSNSWKLACDTRAREGELGRRARWVGTFLRVWKTLPLPGSGGILSSSRDSGRTGHYYRQEGDWQGENARRRAFFGRKLALEDQRPEWSE